MGAATAPETLRPENTVHSDLMSPEDPTYHQLSPSLCPSVRDIWTDFPGRTHLVNCGLEKIDQAQQDGMQTEEDVVGTDGVDSLWVPLQKLLLQDKTSANQSQNSDPSIFTAMQLISERALIL